MSAAITWLSNRGGFYSALDVSNALGITMGLATKMLEKGLASGELESREWQLTGAYDVHRGEPIYRQYRAVQLKAAA